MPTVSGMKGHGFYDQHSTGQRASIEALADWVEQAAGGMRLPASDEPVTVADYGSSEGRNAIDVVGRACEAIRRRSAAQPIRAVFSDLPTNDFNQLFRNLTEAGWLGGRDGIYPSAVGGSFYGPLLPTRSVHLATTFNSVCWFDRVPPACADFVIFPSGPTRRRDVAIEPEVAAACVEQARVDLERFLACRAVELAPGGKLLLAVPGRDAKYWCGGGIYDVLDDACRDLVEAGRIDRAVYERIFMPVYFRSLDELMLALRTAGSPVAEQFSIERAESLRVTPPFVADYERTGDVARYADKFVGFVQAFSEPVVRPLVEPAHGGAAVDAIYERAKELVRTRAGDYPFHYIQVAVLLARR